ncbi:Peroxisomal membrane protein PAS20 [Cladochytrium tenue]|nr:Peroxisomal membrane protein PAS20 [Cladochytrium tenue]
MNPGNPNDLPLSAQIEQSTSSAFQVMEQVVQAFGGFAQMLESTFFATHSSFMAMVGVAEQLGHLRSYVGQVFSAVTVLEVLRRWAYRAVGRAPPVDPSAISVEGFEKFSGSDKAKGSRRPVWLFILFMVGFPWLMSRLIKRLQQQRLEAAAAAAASPTGNPAAPGTGGPASVAGPDGRPLLPSQIKDLEFCRALYAFSGTSPAELSFQKGDVIAILSRTDPATGEPSQWWRGRLRSGPIGYFPANYVEIIEKRAGPSSPPDVTTPVPGS